jgi:uncharacterized protein YciI
MFLLLLKYIVPLDAIDELVPPHREFLDKHYALGKFICSGAQVPRTGGVILCLAPFKDEVKQIIALDPFYQAGAVEYEIIEFSPTKFAKAFEPFIKQ